MKNTTVKEISDFMNWLYDTNVPMDYILMIELLYGSGLRVSELAELTWQNIDFEKGFVKVMGKGRKERLLPITDKALEILKAIYARECVYDKIRKTNRPQVYILDTKKLMQTVRGGKDVHAA